MALRTTVAQAICLGQQCVRGCGFEESTRRLYLLSAADELDSQLSLRYGSPDECPLCHDGQHTCCAIYIRCSPPHRSRYGLRPLGSGASGPDHPDNDRSASIPAPPLRRVCRRHGDADRLGGRCRDAAPEGPVPGGATRGDDLGEWPRRPGGNTRREGPSPCRCCRNRSGATRGRISTRTSACSTHQRSHGRPHNGVDDHLPWPRMESHCPANHG